MLTKVLLMVGMFCFTSQAYATVIYTWVDENGKTHYSQQAPEGIQVTKLYSEDMEQAPIGFIAPVSRAPKSELTQAEKDALVIKIQDKAQAESLCESAKHNLNLLETYNRLTRTDTNPDKKVEMNETDKQAAIKEQQERIRLFCDK